MLNYYCAEVLPRMGICFSYLNDKVTAKMNKFRKKRGILRKKQSICGKTAKKFCPFAAQENLVLARSARDVATP